MGPLYRARTGRGCSALDAARAVVFPSAARPPPRPVIRCLRNRYHSSRDETTGKLKFKGNELKHAAGVPFLVDCNVTGSDVGTATKPCFPLRRPWEFTLIPAIQLVDECGACAGAHVVMQQDNAGPHIEVEYRLWMQHIFDELGWMYEPQAPQGMRNTYTVNLSLAFQLQVLIQMSWICTYFLRCRTGTVPYCNGSPTRNYLYYSARSDPRPLVRISFFFEKLRK
jgi:hypothetical protein